MAEREDGLFFDSGQAQEGPGLGTAARKLGTENLIGEREVEEAYTLLRKYQQGKANLESRVSNAEEWWKNNHWDRFSADSSNENDPRPTSAWLFNSILNKHADFMDNYPIPAILPREESDEETAKLLSDVVPVILEQNGYEEVYSECSWEKPKTGTAVYGVFWNKDKENGLGDIDIRMVDLMNIFWEPGIKDIQKSRNVFTTDLVDTDLLEIEYPQAQGRAMPGEQIQSKYIYDETIDTSGKTQVIDWYYKKRVRTEAGGMRTVLHYCKFIPGVVLYASENDPQFRERGWYDHGKYPFVFDVMFPEKGSPAGFGYLDIMVNPQEYIDKLDQIMLKSASLNRPRYFVSAHSGVNPEEFTDLSRDLVQVEGDVDDHRIKQIEVPQMADYVTAIREAKIEEIKETSGNRDFSQGSTASGVTAASAIAALQEAGSKLSRDMIKDSYNAHAQVVLLVIELVRQFYDLPRCFRITKPNGGDAEYVQMDNSPLQAQTVLTASGDLLSRRPVFDIKVSAQKGSTYSRISNNELAKELFGMGLFNPQLADQALAVVTMMDFDKRDEVIKKISENGTMYQKLQQMGQVLEQLAAMVTDYTGREDLFYAVQSLLGGPAMTGVKVNADGTRKTNSLGETVGGNDNSTASQARRRTAAATEVK